MKILATILLILVSRFAICQTAITPSTPIKTIYSMTPGLYYFLNGADTVYYTACTPITIVKHDTTIITRIDTVLKVTPCPKVDSVAIQSLKTCPAAPKQRTATGIFWDIITNRRTITYDTGEKTIL